MTRSRSSVSRKLTPLARRLLHLAPQQQGNSMVETAVVLPIFLLIFLGFAQYAIVLLTYCNATYACRMASRYASIHSSTSLAPASVSQIESLVTSNLFINPGIVPNPTVVYLYDDGSQCTGNCNVVGNLVVVGVNWSQSLRLGLVTSNGKVNPQSFSIGTQNYKVITR